MTNPPQREELCCYCGHYRYVVQWSRVIGGSHGKYLPGSHYSAPPTATRAGEP